MLSDGLLVESVMATWVIGFALPCQWQIMQVRLRFSGLTSFVRYPPRFWEHGL